MASKYEYIAIGIIAIVIGVGGYFAISGVTTDIGAALKNLFSGFSNAISTAGGDITKTVKSVVGQQPQSTPVYNTPIVKSSKKSSITPSTYRRPHTSPVYGSPNSPSSTSSGSPSIFGVSTKYGVIPLPPATGRYSYTSSGVYTRYLLSHKVSGYTGLRPTFIQTPNVNPVASLRKAQQRHPLYGAVR